MTAEEGVYRYGPAQRRYRLTYAPVVELECPPGRWVRLPHRLAEELIEHIEDGRADKLD